MSRRCCIDKHCEETCKFALLEETTVKSRSCFDGKVYEQRAFNVYCNHPSLKEKRFINWVTWIDEYINPKFDCPIDKKG